MSITGMPGNEVEVDVHHRLPGIMPDIHTEIIAGWMIPLVKQFPEPDGEFHEG